MDKNIQNFNEKKCLEENGRPVPFIKYHKQDFTKGYLQNRNFLDNAHIIQNTLGITQTGALCAAVDSMYSIVCAITVHSL